MNRMVIVYHLVEQKDTFYETRPPTHLNAMSTCSNVWTPDSIRSLCCSASNIDYTSVETNTLCSRTAKASRYAIRRAARSNPNSQSSENTTSILVTLRRSTQSAQSSGDTSSSERSCWLPMIAIVNEEVTHPALDSYWLWTACPP